MTTSLWFSKKNLSRNYCRHLRHSGNNDDGYELIRKPSSVEHVCACVWCHPASYQLTNNDFWVAILQSAEKSTVWLLFSSCGVDPRSSLQSEIRLKTQSAGRNVFNIKKKKKKKKKKKTFLPEGSAHDISTASDSPLADVLACLWSPSALNPSRNQWFPPFLEPQQT